MRQVLKTIVKILLIVISIYYPQYSSANTLGKEPKLKGIIVGKNNEIIDFATIHLKNTKFGTTSDEEGKFKLRAPEGQYTLVVTAIGYENYEQKVTIKDNESTKIQIVLTEKTQNLDEVMVVSDGLTRVKESPYNAIAIDTKSLRNSTLSLSDALAKAPGVKVREAGGVGSDMQLMMDGFTGKHIKVFIDGIPQEGVGTSFGLNNIPANYAERIEVYKGVVPVGFGTDAIGGVINVVTKKNNSNRWFADAAYSYGSFNTHKSYVNFGQTFKSGLTYEVNAFQNYSDNDYKIETYVEDFETGIIDKSKIEKVKRFHDKYHNEAVMGKVGIVNKKWADRLMIGLTYSNMSKDIQNGVRQQIVYGAKKQKSHSLMPSLEYSKLELIKGLDVYFTMNYNSNIVNNIDTSTTEYNWRGESRKKNSPGEQSYQYTRSTNNNWNGTATVNYRLGEKQLFTLNHLYNDFVRSNKSMLSDGAKDPIKKKTQKNITGFSYRYLPIESLNISPFLKYYSQHITGPVSNSAQTEVEKTSSNTDKLGYGLATSYFILPNLQTKLSYEKAFRLPTIEESFGDEDLETGSVKIKPENSNNFNFNLNYNLRIDKHFIMVEGGLIYRNTKDYIKRNIESIGGGKYAAAYMNYGKVKTTGFNISARYAFSNWISLGGNYSELNAKDNEKVRSNGTSLANPAYKSRMPNTPYRFFNSDITFYWNRLGGKENNFTFTYDNQYTHSFPLYSEALGTSNSDFNVPSQFSHNIRLTYALKKGKYNLSFECKNFTNEKMYDNFSLQKPGRSFYGKIRVSFGG